MFRFIISAFGDEFYPELDKQMELLAAYNIRFIEMRGVNGKALVEHSLEEVQEIKKVLDQQGFRISAIGSPIGKVGINDDFAPHLELFRHTVDIAQILQTRYIRMFSFYIPEGESPEKYREQVMERWSQFVRIAEETGIILLHENEKDIYGDTAERCLDLITTMNSPHVRATFDPANFVQCDVEPYPHAYNLLRDKIEYVHIKDAVFHDYSNTFAGEGDGKLQEILSALYTSGYAGFLTLEPHMTSFHGLHNLERDTNVLSKMEASPEALMEKAVSCLRGLLHKIDPACADL